MKTTRRLLRTLVPATVAVAALATYAAPSFAADTATPDPGQFTTTIDNPYLPFKPGTVMRYRESGNGQGTDVVRVTRRTKVIQGVTCVVVRDRAFMNGKLVEDTRDWYAQDSKGNVWYFGEDTKEYKNGKVTSTAGTWMAGRDGARAGIIMQAHPRVGQTYHQEYAAGVAEDQATVLSRTETAKVPYGSFNQVLKTKDFTALEPKKVEEKYYARGVGSVLETLVKGGHERLVLVSVEHR